MRIEDVGWGYHSETKNIFFRLLDYIFAVLLLLPLQFAVTQHGHESDQFRTDLKNALNFAQKSNNTNTFFDLCPDTVFTVFSVWVCIGWNPQPTNTFFILLSFIVSAKYIWNIVVLYWSNAIDKSRYISTAYVTIYVQLERSTGGSEASEITTAQDSN